MSHDDNTQREPTPMESAFLNAALCAEGFVTSLAYMHGVEELKQMRLNATSSYDLQTIAVMEAALEANMFQPSASLEA